MATDLLAEPSPRPADSLILETCDCPLCGEHERDHTPYRSGDVRVVRCKTCRLWYLSPRPTAAALAEIYSSGDYFEGDGNGNGYDSYSQQTQALRATFRRFLNTLQRRGMAGGSLLEVGCGYGFLLEQAAPFFDTCSGCDFSAAALEKVECTDLLYVGGVDSLPADDRYDCIVATHVIEHVHEPNSFVADLASRLSPGGWLVLAAPDMGSFWRKLMRHRWPSFKFPEHVVYYDRRSLNRLFATAGLENTTGIPYPHAFPLSLVLEKLGIRRQRWLDSLNCWMPATTVAVAGQYVVDN